MFDSINSINRPDNTAPSYQNEKPRRSAKKRKSIFDFLTGAEAKELSLLAHHWSSYGYQTQLGYTVWNRDHNGMKYSYNRKPIRADSDWVYISLGRQDVEDSIYTSAVYLRANQDNVFAHNYIVATDEEKQKAVFAMINHAKNAWGGEVEINGSDEFKIRAWTEAQRQGVKVTNFDPPPNVAERILKSLEEENGPWADPQRRPPFDVRNTPSNKPRAHKIS